MYLVGFVLYSVSGKKSVEMLIGAYEPKTFICEGEGAA